IVRASGLGQGCKWCDIPIHAEYPVRSQHRGGWRTLGEQPASGGGIAMGVAAEASAGEQPGIDERGMAQPVEQHRFAAARERGHDTEVGHVAGREKKRPLAPGESGQLFLERCVLPSVAADEMRGAAAGAAPCRAFRHCRGECRMGSEPEIIVAAEVDQPPATDDHYRAAALVGICLYRRAVAPQMLTLDLLERRLKRLSLHCECKTAGCPLGLMA